jgi:hypothetical protein
MTATSPSAEPSAKVEGLLYSWFLASVFSKCHGFSIGDNTEIRIFKIPTRLTVPPERIILLQLSILRHAQRLGTNPD